MFDSLEFNHVVEQNSEYNEGGGFIVPTLTTIFGYKSEDESKTEIGTILSFKFLMWRAYDERVDIVECADDISEDLYLAAKIISNKRINNLRRQNVVYISSLYIEPKYRGHNFGLVALNNTIEYHDPSTLNGIIICPNSRSLIDENDPYFSIPKSQGLNKLKKLYGKIGFSSLRTHKNFMWKKFV